MFLELGQHLTDSIYLGTLSNDASSKQMTVHSPFLSNFSREDEEKAQTWEEKCTCLWLQFSDFCN